MPDRRLTIDRASALAIEPLLALLGLAIMAVGTVPALAADADRWFDAAALGVSALFALAFWRRWRRSRGPGSEPLDITAALDVVSAVVVPSALLIGHGNHDARLFGVVWALSIVRGTSAFRLIGRVLQAEREPLLGVLAAFLVILFLAATFAHLLEREAQPGTFGSLPQALWWGIVTITTTGYGDAVPSTLGGRVLAGLLMVTGIAVFALWAGILAIGFGQELRRRDFVRTWELVAQVPLFQSQGAATITEISRRLRTRRIPAGRVVMRRGDPGDAMFFIADGELEVELPDRRVRLAAGDFVGELALISGAPRMATVVATKPSTLLVLGVAEFRELAASRPELMRAIEAEASNRRAMSDP